tara:strand:- start:84 stop:1652 length:1569 start_codon:yes stop_codon:yes gene_type:complete
MPVHHRIFVCIAAAMVLALSGGSSALAEWRRAESPKFIVYSNGREAALREYVQKLETYDYIMRVRLGLPIDALPDRKFPIYLVNGRRDLLRVHPASGANVAGTYFPREEDIFAVAIMGEGDDTLLHEYAHHFMFQNSHAVYPGWLTEGFAEYFMTADIRSDQVVIGGYNENRVYWLQSSSWIPLQELLSNRPHEVRRSNHKETYYPVAWLLTHWLMGTPERRTIMAAYLSDIAEGGDPVEAMERATGQSLAELTRTLRSYFNGRVPMTRYRQEFARTNVDITVLPRSADDLLLLGQRLKVGVDEDERAATAEDVRRAAANYPDDSFAQLQLGHAELHFGDPAVGAPILTRLLEREPDNVEALHLLASDEQRKARETDDDPVPYEGVARGYLARAFRADETSYLTYIMLGEMQSYGQDGPSENDVATWQLAFQIAPQLSQTRLGYAQVLLMSGESARAEALLAPLANAPHGGGAAEAAQNMLERIRAGERTLDAADIEAVNQGDAEDPGPEPDQTDPADDDGG